MRITVTEDAARYLLKKGGTIYLCYNIQEASPG